MTDPFAKTRYRVAQHWRFQNDTPEVRDILTIQGVEDHPTQGIICTVCVNFVPFPQAGRSSGSGYSYICVTQAALNRSVIELVMPKGPLRGGSTGDFQRSTDSWGQFPFPLAQDQPVGDIIHNQIEQLRRHWAEVASRPLSQKPPVAALGLWSLIAEDESARFRELLQQHPSLANTPLSFDGSDDYCRPNEDCYPLMLAARMGSVAVAEVLFEFGADPKQRNADGDTALHFARRFPRDSHRTDEVARMLCERGADPEARNARGETPLTVPLCSPDVAAVLIRFGARPTLNHAIRLRMLDWARRELRDNPNAIRDTVSPRTVLGDIGQMIREEAERRHGREVRLHRGEIPAEGEDDRANRRAYSEFLNHQGSSTEDEIVAIWHHHAELERAVFEEHCDLLDMALARGADPSVGCPLCDAVQMFDTSLAEWLLTHGADPNRDVKGYLAPFMSDFARTRRMLNLLHRYGVQDNPYTKMMEPWEERVKELRDRLKEKYN